MTQNKNVNIPFSNTGDREQDKALEEEYCETIIYTDFSKVFDRFRTNFFEKLRRLGYNDTLINWLNTFLSERKKRKLLEPFIYILQVPGKNVRSKLSRAFNYWLNIPEDKGLLIEDIVQMLHNASLLLDDIEDSSILRRGIPVAHSIYGIASTINAANYVMFIGLEKCLILNHPEATTVYTEQLLELHRGQGMEIYWRDKFICPTEAEYCDMTKKKTGGLFMLGIRLMQLFSANKQDYTKLAGILGLYFQIRDDYLNLYSEEYAQNKSYCEDLTEGKFSFPLVHAIHSQADDNQVMQILRQRTKDVEVKKYCVCLLEKYGSFDYTRKRLAELDTEARDEVRRLGDNPYMEEFLDLVFKTMPTPPAKTYNAIDT